MFTSQTALVDPGCLLHTNGAKIIYVFIGHALGKLASNNTAQDIQTKGARTPENLESSRNTIK